MSRQGDWHTIASLQEQIAELHVTTVEQADLIEQLETERDDALQDLHHYRKHLASVEGELDAHRKEVKRLHYFALVIDEHAENIKTEAAIALRPQHIKAPSDG